jgi:phosphohistidine phosphatase SixA
MEQAAQGLRSIFDAQTVLTSPLLRARQTADIISAAYGVAAPRMSNALASGEHLRLFAGAARAGVERVVAVGHEPHISSALALALSGDSDAFVAVFKKGAAALLLFEAEVEPGRASLLWLLQPAQLRALAPTATAWQSP